MMSRRKIALVALQSLFLLSLAGTAYLDFYFGTHCPRSPRPETGNIYREVANKAEVYLTWREMLASQLAALSWTIWFAAALYFGARWKFIQIPARAPKAPAATDGKKRKRFFGIFGR